MRFMSMNDWEQIQTARGVSYIANNITIKQTKQSALGAKIL